MAESVVKDFSSKFPVCIVRPSIVTGAVNEPHPGWSDNVLGITGIMIEISRGMLSSIISDENVIMDVIPVDIVVNTIIAAAWSNSFLPYGKNHYFSNEILIYFITLFIF